MKQYLLVSFLLLATHFMAVEVAAQNKQHKSVSPTTELVDTTGQGLDAYSDTSSVATSQAADSANAIILNHTLGDEQLSDDLAQDTFLKVYTHIT